MQFSGNVTSFDRKTDIETVDAGTLVEITDLTRDGQIEIAFNDRNERCYLKFRLTDLMAAMASQFGKSGS